MECMEKKHRPLFSDGLASGGLANCWFPGEAIQFERRGRDREGKRERKMGEESGDERVRFHGGFLEEKNLRMSVRGDRKAERHRVCLRIIFLPLVTWSGMSGTSVRSVALVVVVDGGRIDISCCRVNPWNVSSDRDVICDAASMLLLIAGS